MFYVKNKKEFVQITANNTYTTCPMCGTIHQIDLGDLMVQSGGDLTAVKVYCHSCSVARAKRHRGREWAEQLIGEGV